MSEKKPTVKKKVRAEKYDPKVKFAGTLEDMIKIAVKPTNDVKKYIKHK